MNSELFIFLVFATILLLMFTYFVPLNLWITAQFSGVRVELTELMFMKIRKSPVKEIILGLIACTKAGVKITRVELETHALAGGDVTALTRALITAKKMELDVSLQELTAVDLSGKDLAGFLHLKKNQTRPGYAEKREGLANQITHQLTDNQIDELERVLGRMETL